MYKYFFKRFFDIILSLLAAIVLLPVFIIVAIAIFIDDPGPVFFKQKRVGKNKKLFWLLKFRSMKVKTPDIPTHLLENPDQYITRVGRFLRKTSLDELPQIYNILFGKMSIIGPRPALWNQDDLIAERDKYGVNDVRPGLTGWAQINGRDELEIPVKAKLDGDYVAKLNSGWFRGLAMDTRCFFGTFISVFRSEGVVEGGTGEMKKQEEEAAKLAEVEAEAEKIMSAEFEEAPSCEAPSETAVSAEVSTGEGGAAEDSADLSADVVEV